jgi:endonuclease G
MDLRRPGRKLQKTKKSPIGLIITLALILGMILLFWWELKNFQSTASNKIESRKDYLPAANQGRIYDKPYFSLSYVEQYELPEWVAYRPTREMLHKPKHPRDQDFNPDPAIVSGSAHYHDYKQSGYTKGHLVPAADMSWDLQAMNATFLMSNVAPMLHDFNEGIWLELEHDVRDWAWKYDNVIVITGPIFRDALGQIGENHVLVPRYFYKAVFTIDNRKPEVIGFIFDQQNKKPGTLDQYIVPIDSIEKETGLDLFANMYGSWENEILMEKQKGNVKGEWSFNPQWYQERMENH